MASCVSAVPTQAPRKDGLSSHPPRLFLGVLGSSACQPHRVVIWALGIQGGVRGPSPFKEPCNYPKLGCSPPILTVLIRDRVPPYQNPN